MMKEVLLFAFIFHAFYLVAQDTKTSREVVYTFSEPFEGMSSYMGFQLGYKVSVV